MCEILDDSEANRCLLSKQVRCLPLRQYKLLLLRQNYLLLTQDRCQPLRHHRRVLLRQQKSALFQQQTFALSQHLTYSEQQTCRLLSWKAHDLSILQVMRKLKISAFHWLCMTWIAYHSVFARSQPSCNQAMTAFCRKLSPVIAQS